MKEVLKLIFAIAKVNHDALKIDVGIFATDLELMKSPIGAAD